MKNENTVNFLNMRNFVIWDLSAPFALKKTYQIYCVENNSLRLALYKTKQCIKIE